VMHRALFHSETLVYLGRGGGSIVLYDFKNQRTWKVPENSIIMRIEPCEKGPSAPDCDLG
jgi:hypothetical protein